MSRWKTWAAILAAAVCLSTSAPAFKVTPLDDKTVSVEISTSGKTREDAIQKARVEAVLGAAGRVLIDDQMIRADDLLENYLRNYASQFVGSVEVVSERFAGGENVLQSRVFIDNARLVDDLREKRFLYSPAYKPMFAVFIEETRDGVRQPEPEVARTLLENALRTVDLKPYGGTISTPPMNVDVALDSDLLAEALVASERRNVELLITGTSVTTLREEKKVYYDTFYFYDCEMSAQLIRVDTGEVLHKTTAQGSSSAKDRAEAIQLSVTRAAEAVAKSMDTEYRSFWPRVVQSGSDYEVLLTGTNDELIRIVTQHLNQVGSDTQINVKKQFGGSAVLTVKTSAGREAIIQTLRGCPYPALTIIRELGSRKFEVQVAG